MDKFFKQIPDKLSSFFKDAIDKKIMKNEINPVILSDLITSPYAMITLFSEMNKVHKNKDIMDPAFRQNFVDQQLLILFSSIIK